MSTTSEDKADPELVERYRATLAAAFTQAMDRKLLNLPLQTEMAKVAFLHGVFAGLSCMLKNEVSPEEAYRQLVAISDAVVGELEELERDLVQYGAE